MIVLINEYVTNLINKNLDIFRDKTFLFLEEENQFIYSDISSKAVSGLSQSLHQKIIKSHQITVKNGIYYHKIEMPTGELGYTSLDDSIRLYRLPNLFAKIKSADIDASIQFQENINLTEYDDKLLKIYYAFKQHDKLHLIINKIGAKTLGLVVNISDVNFLNNEFEDIQVTLMPGSKLYKTSQFNEEVLTIQKEAEVKIISYLEGTDKYRIRYKGTNYWVEYDHFPIDEKIVVGKLIEELSGNEEALELLDNVRSINDNIHNLKDIEREYENFKNSVYKNLRFDNDFSMLVHKDNG